MRLAVVTAGTRGDVQPHIALATGLAARGHDVWLATHEPFRALVEAHGIAFRGLPGDPADIFDGPPWTEFELSSRRPLTHARALHATLAPLLSQLSDEACLEACRGADAVLFNPTAGQAEWAARQLGVPAVLCGYWPSARTGAFAHPVLFPTLRLGAAGNRLSHVVAEKALRAPFQEPLRPDVRRAVGLPATPRLRPVAAWPPFPCVFGFSPALVPRPADWPAHLHVTGTWTLPVRGAATLPEHVEAYLEAGPPPVFLSFGSIRPADPARLSDVVARALAATGLRAVVQAPWLEAGIPDVLPAGPLDHAALLGRVSAVVHHGGAGTTAAGLLAGRPTFVVPFAFDQAFWGARAAALGAGPRPVPSSSLTASRLERALQVLQDPATRRAAEELGGRMRAEDGVATAAVTIEGLLAAGGTRST